MSEPLAVLDRHLGRPGVVTRTSLGLVLLLCSGFDLLLAPLPMAYVGISLLQTRLFF